MTARCTWARWKTLAGGREDRRSQAHRGGRAFLAAGKPPPLQPAELQALPWLALQTFYRNEVALTRRHAGRDSEEVRFAIQPRLGTDSLFALRNATLLGLGASIASTWLVAEDVAEGRLLHLAPQWCAAPLPVYLIYPYSNFYPAKLRRFIEALREGCPRAWAWRRARRKRPARPEPRYFSHRPFSTMSIRRPPICSICGPRIGPSGPSMTSMARPCTADQARNSAPGRRSGDITPAPTSLSIAAPSSSNGSSPLCPLRSAIARRTLGSCLQIVRGPEGRAEQPALRLRKAQVAGADRAQVGAGEFGRR